MSVLVVLFHLNVTAIDTATGTITLSSSVEGTLRAAVYLVGPV